MRALAPPSLAWRENYDRIRALALRRSGIPDEMFPPAAEVGRNGAAPGAAEMSKRYHEVWRVLMSVSMSRKASQRARQREALEVAHLMEKLRSDMIVSRNTEDNEQTTGRGTLLAVG